MALPSYIPCISEVDCCVPLPEVDSSDEQNLADLETGEIIAPIQYHRVMAQISITIHRFRMNLRYRRMPPQQVVLQADAQLAELIDTMPSHLQPDAPHDLRREEMHPWIAWQKWDLSLVFLYYRLHINRTLQRCWLSAPEILSGPRSICVSSAKGIVWVTQHSNQPIAKRRQW